MGLLLKYLSFNCEDVYLFIFLSGGFESRQFIRGLQGRSISMRASSKTKDTLSKVIPLRWSLGSKERHKPDSVHRSVKEPAPVELVQYLESGRRPQCTKDPIVSLTSEPNSRKNVAEALASSSVQSSSVKSLSHESRAGHESPRVPEGQKRPSEKTSSLIRSKTSQTREETSRKDAKKQSFKVSHHIETKRCSHTGVQPSNSIPSLHNGTLRRQTGDGTEKEYQNTYEGNSKTMKAEVLKSNEGLRSFFKGNFLRKDKDSGRTKDGKSGKDSGEEGTRRTHSKLSMSNRAAGGETGLEEGKLNDSGYRGNETANGKVGGTPAGIRGSQSSSDIPTKAAQSMRRTASLHHNGMSRAPAPSHSHTMDKSSRTRYSTNSLGRKRTVPESSF